MLVFNALFTVLGALFGKVLQSVFTIDWLPFGIAGIAAPLEAVIFPVTVAELWLMLSQEKMTTIFCSIDDFCKKNYFKLGKSNEY